MAFQHNWDLARAFYCKTVTLVDTDTGKSITLKAPVVKDFFDYAEESQCLQTWKQPFIKLKKDYSLMYNTVFEWVCDIIFFLGKNREFKKIKEIFEKTLKYILPDIIIDKKTNQFIVKDVILDQNWWDYILYILQLIGGAKNVSTPTTNISAKERAFNERQAELEARMAAIREKGRSEEEDKEGLVKTFLTICYAFPFLSFADLFDQTMAQIHWLHTYAGKSVSYNIQSQVYAAGNMKKNSNFEFFIKQ